MRQITQPFSAAGPDPRDPSIRTTEIQGDVLIGLQKDLENFVFFKIEDVAAFKRAWRDQLITRVTTTEVVRLREIEVLAARQANQRQRLPLTGFNIAFTHSGLKTLLGAGNVQGMDPSFTAGAAAAAVALGDPVSQEQRPLWIEAFTREEIHGVFLFTGPLGGAGHERDLVQAKTRKVLNILGSAIRVVYQEMGAVRPQRGHEHFGFLDDVSNPGVRGVTQRQNPVNDDQGLPGQDLLWPGSFVFGYPGQDPNKPFEEPGAEPAMAHEWMRDGSYMVFRRLNQFVPEFHGFIRQQGQALGIDATLLGARMVGRWQSGAPVMIAPLQDEPLLGTDPLHNNNFEFSTDPEQRRCPYAAHIRKAYPRDDLEGVIPNGEGFVQSHRIMRAGIPFGPEVQADEEDGTKHERGLMFVCYQTSIVEQFEFVQRQWANNPGFVLGKTRPGGGAVQPGHDPIIGQTQGSAPRSMDEPLPNYPVGSTRSTLNMPERFISPSAAAYMFVPSISALRALHY